MLGNLHISFRLDSPRRVYYGPDDPISGKVFLKYGPHANAVPELFGPLDVEVSLIGMVHVTDEIMDRGLHDRRRLFTQVEKIHEGPFKAVVLQEYTLPFSISFPEQAEPRRDTVVGATQTSDGRWTFRQHVSNITVLPLPPSLLSVGAYSRSHNRIEVHYELSVTARMPGINIAIITTGPHSREVLYDLPRVPSVAATSLAESSIALEHHIAVEDKALIPRDDRPHGLKGKTKALFNSSIEPRYACNLCCEGPEHLFVGQPLKFTIRLSTDYSKTTSTMIPEILLDCCTVSLIAITAGKSTSTSGEKVSHRETIRSKDPDISPAGPFTKQHDFTKTIEVGVLSRIPSTFDIGELSRDYKLRLNLQLSTIGRRLHVNRQIAVTVHPPLLEEEDPMIGSSNVSDGIDVMDGGVPDEPLPSYTEI